MNNIHILSHVYIRVICILQYSMRFFSIGLKNKTKLETVIYNSKDESRKIEK